MGNGKKVKVRRVNLAKLRREELEKTKRKLYELQFMRAAMDKAIAGGEIFDNEKYKYFKDLFNARLRGETTFRKNDSKLSGVKNWIYKKTRESAISPTIRLGESTSLARHGFTPEEQFKYTGIVDEQLHDRSKRDRNFNRNYTPWGYRIGDAIGAVFGQKDYIRRDYNKSLKKPPSHGDYVRRDQARQEAFDLYNGKPIKGEYLRMSKYRPNGKPFGHKDANNREVYWALNGWAEADAIATIKKRRDAHLDAMRRGVHHSLRSYGKDYVTGRSTTLRRQDTDGRWYTAYLDNWNLNDLAEGDWASPYGQPFTIYDRYYDDELDALEQKYRAMGYIKN